MALLRTCKSEVAAGIAPERIAAAGAQDDEWRTSGRWGVIQFVTPHTGYSTAHSDGAFEP